MGPNKYLRFISDYEISTKKNFLSRLLNLKKVLLKMSSLDLKRPIF